MRHKQRRTKQQITELTSLPRIAMGITCMQQQQTSRFFESKTLDDWSCSLLAYSCQSIES